MEIIPIFLPKNAGRNAGKQVGFLNLNTKTYHKEISFKRSQMMQHKKYIGNLGVSKSVIGILQSYGCEKFEFVIRDFESDDKGKDKPFKLLIDLKKFLEKGRDWSFDDAQVRCHMSEWKRASYP